jgi:hypothetical protein
MIKIFGTERIDNYPICKCKCGSLSASVRLDAESSQALVYCHGCRITRPALFPWERVQSQESRNAELCKLTAALVFSRLEIGTAPEIDGRELGKNWPI